MRAEEAGEHGQEQQRRGEEAQDVRGAGHEPAPAATITKPNTPMMPSASIT